ncbi:bile acid:sodium symporter family protein [Planococcus kocurii]|uniref:Bile acid:sodium symporter n=1 Tax=Planococcus kocurii TaxID=1374 RepID=A0ABM5WYX2_9BACL|nr:MULTISPECIES: bile acid:sodium symporter [Planococcus]ALS79530.1 bile acid:sodium symporter [Planococcus kocurii]KAA0956957.1 bile acid:sodium symporter family protein [Planococcus sp. ANT_H30]
MSLIMFISSKLPFLILLVSIATYFSPVYWQVSSWVPSLLLGAVIFFAGLSMNIEAFKQIKKKTKELLVITGLKWTLTVSVSIALAHLFFSSKPEIAAGLILAGTVPSATAATVYTFLAGGNASLVVVASLLDVVISPVVTPLAMLGLSSEQISLSFSDLLTSFFLIVVLPMGLGLWIQKIIPNLNSYTGSVTKLGTSLALLVIVHTIIGSGKEAITSELATIPLIAVATFIQVTLPMASAYLIAKGLKMEEQDARAALFQVGLCNTALAAILAYKFIGELGVIAPIFNMIFNLSIGAMIANRFSKINSNLKEQKWIET